MKMMITIEQVLQIVDLQVWILKEYEK
jgi:hypothetical protein